MFSFLKTLFTSKQSSVLLGIDLTSTALRILALNKEADSVFIQGYGEQILDKSIFLDKTQLKSLKDKKNTGKTPYFLNTTYLSQMLKQLLERSNLSCRSAALAVSGPSVFTKTIQFDHTLEEHALVEELEHNFEGWFPLQFEEVYYDYQYLKNDTNNRQTSEVLIAVAEKKLIQQHIDWIEAAGLRLEVIEVKNLALSRAVQYLYEDSLTTAEHPALLVAEVNPLQATVSLLQGGRILYTSEIQWPAELFAEQAAFNLVDKHSKSELLTQQLAIVSQKLSQTLLKTAELFKQKLGFSSNLPPVILLGDFPELESLKNCLTHLPIRDAVKALVLADPLSNFNLTVTDSKNEVATSSAKWMTCCGLSLRAFLDDRH